MENVYAILNSVETNHDGDATIRAQRGLLTECTRTHGNPTLITSGASTLVKDPMPHPAPIPAPIPAGKAGIQTGTWGRPTIDHAQKSPILTLVNCISVGLQINMKYEGKPI